MDIGAADGNGVGSSMMMNRMKLARSAYVRMSSDLLDDRIIKMSRITQEVTSNVICVLDALKYIACNGKLPTFSELSSAILTLEVDVLHPTVVDRSSSLRNVLLEDDDVGVWDLYGVRRGEKRSSTFVDGFGAECGCR